MTILSNNGEDIGFAASLLWPESERKYNFELKDFSSWMTIRNITIKDAGNYRCMLDLVNPGRTHAVSVVSGLFCRAVKASEVEMHLCDGNPIIKITSPPPFVDPYEALNSIHCVATVSGNVDDDLRFNLYELKNGIKVEHFATSSNLTLDGSDNVGLDADERMDDGTFGPFMNGESPLAPLIKQMTEPVMMRVGCRRRSSYRIDVIFPLNSTTNARRGWRVEAITSDDYPNLDYYVVEEPDIVGNDSVSMLPFTSSSSISFRVMSIQSDQGSTSKSISIGASDAPEVEFDNSGETVFPQLSIHDWLGRSAVIVTFSVIGALLTISLLSMALYYCMTRTKKRRQVSTYTIPCVTPKSSLPDIWI